MASARAFNTGDVARAISLYLGVDANRAEVQALASRVSLDGINLPPGGHLHESSDFRSRLFAAGGQLILDIADPSRRAQIQEDVRTLPGGVLASDLLGWHRRDVPVSWIASADAGDGESGESAAASGYSGDINSINQTNYARTPFCRAGMPYGLFHELRGQGFTRENIINAMNDARALGFRANDREAMRDHALIDRHSIDARGMNQALQDYQRRTREDAELNALILRRQQAVTEEQQRALDAQIAARRLEHERASGLHPRLTNPEEDRRAREGGRRRKDAVDRQQEELLRLSPHLTDEHVLGARVHAGQAELNRIHGNAVAEDRERQTGVGDLLASAGLPSPAPTTTTGGAAPAVIQRADATQPAATRPTQTAQAEIRGGPALS